MISIVLQIAQAYPNGAGAKLKTDQQSLYLLPRYINLLKLHLALLH
ncbi:hypothetical protein ACKUZO_021655 [Acinetobacter baumannii]